MIKASLILMILSYMGNLVPHTYWSGRKKFSRCVLEIP